MAMLRLVAASQGNHYRHRVVALHPEGDMRARLEACGIEVTAFDFKRAPLQEFVQLVRLIRDARPDIVQTWLYHGDFIGGLAARIAGVRRVMWGIHSVDVRGVSSRSTVYLCQANAFLSRWIPRVVVTVAETARQKHLAIGYDPSKFVVIPNGFDIRRMVFDADRRTARRRELGIADDEHVVGWVGRFNAAKDCGTFLRAAGILRQRLPQVRVRFFMVGNDLSEDNAELMRDVQAAGVGDRLTLCGQQRDIPDFLVAFDCFCMSSRTEAFPLVLGEAMCMSLPCVSTNVGDAGTLLGNTGRLVPPREPQLLADALADVLALPAAERRAMGERARARIEARFSLEHTRSLYEARYEQLMHPEVEAR